MADLQRGWAGSRAGTARCGEQTAAQLRQRAAAAWPGPSARTPSPGPRPQPRTRSASRRSSSSWSRPLEERIRARRADGHLICSVSLSVRRGVAWRGAVPPGSIPSGPTRPAARATGLSLSRMPLTPSRTLAPLKMDDLIRRLLRRQCKSCTLLSANPKFIFKFFFHEFKYCSQRREINIAI